MFSRLYRYGRTVNSHDLLKVIATLLMIVDHLGYYVLADNPWFRLLGRGAAPLFFFLIGTARSHRFKWSLLLYGTILTLVNAFFLDQIYLNILINFVFIKAFFNHCAIEEYDSTDFIAIIVILILGNLWLTPYIEYGTSGLLFAISARLTTLGDPRGRPLLLFTTLYHFTLQAILFQFTQSPTQLIAITCVGCFIAGTLYYYKHKEWNVGLSTIPVLIVSRYSLGIYFYHLLFLKFYFLYHLFKTLQI